MPRFLVSIPRPPRSSFDHLNQEEENPRSMLTKNHYLMHCRPRLEFHLGHVQVLGKLHRLLVEGHRVTVLVIPYDEHEAHNRTFQCRLREDVELTKAFYRSYLGFESRQLEVISTYDFEIIASDIEREHAAFQEMYCQADTVRRLVDVHGRTWASTQTTFIAKCIASIRRFTPTHTICGHKHQLISAAFKSLLERNGRAPIPACVCHSSRFSV